MWTCYNPNATISRLTINAECMFSHTALLCPLQPPTKWEIWDATYPELD